FTRVSNRKQNFSLEISKFKSVLRSQRTLIIDCFWQKAVIKLLEMKQPVPQTADTAFLPWPQANPQPPLHTPPAPAAPESAPPSPHPQSSDPYYPKCYGDRHCG